MAQQITGLYFNIPVEKKEEGNSAKVSSPLEFPKKGHLVLATEAV